MKTESGESAFTLIEMLVATAVFGIVMLALAQFYSNFVRAARKSRAYASIDQNLTLIVNRMGESLKSAARGNRVAGENPFEFVGIDGDGKFVASGDTPHRTLTSSINPNDASDRLHFHALIPKRLTDNILAGHVTDRFYFAFWLNGETSPTTKNELKNSWGVLMRKKGNGGSDTLPNYPEDGSDKQSPVTDLNTAGVSHSGAHPVSVLGRHVDYLSFQYYDDQAQTWVNDWNTRGTEAGRFPAAVRIALRGYDPRADHTVDESRLVPPEWTTTTVSLKGSE